MPHALYAAVLALLFVACYTDLRSLRIPNPVPIAVAGLFLPFAIATGMSVADVLWHLAAGASVLAAGFAVFAIGLRFGGGDIKLLSALALWCGFGNFLPFFVAMSFAGGAVAMLVFLARQTGVPVWLAVRGVNIPAFALERSKAYVPYAPAIALGFAYLGPLAGG
ncbi:MAG TPA: prepilin peptidase [Stellaceae bacterium]|nr:prepilin peptidase [Stellaceae bacterium]